MAVLCIKNLALFNFHYEMEAFRIRSGNKLYGKIYVRGSKNAATKLIAASLLTSDTCTLVGLPNIEDVVLMLDIIKHMGAEVKQTQNKTTIRCLNIDIKKIPNDKIIELRSSVVLIGPLLARFGYVKMAYPGGDKIGARPLTAHFNAFRDLGFDVKEDKDFFSIIKPLNPPKIRKIILDEFSVTATENVLMYTSAMQGSIEILIAAGEPHIQNLVEYLNKMGAKITIEPNHVIKVRGTSNLVGATQRVISDYIEAGTLVIAVLVIGGDVLICNFPTEHLELFLQTLKRAGANIEIKNKRTVRVKTSDNFQLSKIQVMIYPGIPTDLQTPLGVLATQSNGSTFIHDPLFENRLEYLRELEKMGAKIEILDLHRAKVYGPTKLKGISVRGKDIRGGMSFIIAGLIAEGETIIEDAYQVDKGYEKIDERLRALGANIKRITI